VLHRDFLFGRHAEQTLVEINEGRQSSKDQRKKLQHRFASLADMALCLRSATEQALAKIMTTISIMHEILLSEHPDDMFLHVI